MSCRLLHGSMTHLLLQAEVLQNWGETVVTVGATLPDSQLSQQAELQASSLAQNLFQQSVETYQQVCSAPCIHSPPICTTYQSAYRSHGLVACFHCFCNLARTC